MRNDLPPSPTFKGMSSPTFNFDSLIDGTRATPFMIEIDLTTARSFSAGTATQVKITGNCLLVDSAPDVGAAQIIFEGVQDETGPLVRPAIYCRPGFIARMPFWNLRLANTAQPGKKLRLIYGVDLDFSYLSPGAVEAVPGAMAPSNSYFDDAGMTLNVPITAIAPATNPNGLIIYRASCSALASFAAINLIAKSSAPASASDGLVIAAGDGAGGDPTNSYSAFFRMEQPIYIRAGLGVYWFPKINSGSVIRHILYTPL